MSEIKVLGTTNDVTACECCGRAGLKGTVALSFSGAAPTYYGVVCAARATGRTERAVRRAVKAADEALRIAAANAAAYVAAAERHHSRTAAVAVAACRGRNAGYQGQVTVLCRCEAFYAFPSHCTAHVDACLAAGWTEVA